METHCSTEKPKHPEEHQSGIPIRGSKRRTAGFIVDQVALEDFSILIHISTHLSEDGENSN
jgi:hypothetical protein